MNKRRQIIKANKRKGKGFASMTDERRRLISSIGGKAAHAQGKAHEYTREEAKRAGSKGGKAPKHY